MPPTDSPPPADESAATTDESAAATDGSSSANEPTRRAAMERATADATAPGWLTRRGAMKTTAGLSAAALGLGAGVAGSASGNVAEDAFQQLSVSDDNRIVTEDGEPFVVRGVTIPDPKRGYRTRYIRGKTPTQIVDLLTDNQAGWYPRVVRVPAQPQDIAELPMGFTGPEYEEGELSNPDPVADTRRKERPPQPQAFEREDLLAYLEEYYDPVVERCRERGVYCIVDYHRHWHEQPPGEEEPRYAENHLPYDSEYTNYWAYNDYDGEGVSFSDETPASWGWVEQQYTNEGDHEYDTWDGVQGEEDIPGTPYEYDNWNVNQELLDEALLFWEVVAERYGEMDHVIFEPYHEPTEPAIIGPAEGCGAFRQKPLWDTYVDEFVGPIIEQIREDYDGLLLVGVPNWSRGVQALHWRSFEDAGYEDVAVTWHNHTEDDVTQVYNWFNDRDYRGPEDVEAETGGRLDDPYTPVDDSKDQQDCWGWERYESEGLQEAMEHHPIAVTEFGWEERTDAWIYPGPSRHDTTNTYGEPIFEGLEADPRISWVASYADVRWIPRLFAFPEGVEEGELADALEDENFYEPDFEDLPKPCEELPCEWELRGNPDSGAYIKERLAEHADDAVPFDTRPHGPGDCVTVGSEDATVDGQLVCDLDGDEQYRDVDADGAVGQSDVAEFFQNQHREAWKQPEKFDFSGNGDVTHGDVVELFDYVALN